MRDSSNLPAPLTEKTSLSDIFSLGSYVMTWFNVTPLDFISSCVFSRDSLKAADSTASSLSDETVALISSNCLCGISSMQKSRVTLTPHLPTLDISLTSGATVFKTNITVLFLPTSISPIISRLISRDITAPKKSRCDGLSASR